MIGWEQWLPAVGICAALALAAYRLRARQPGVGGAPLETLASTPLAQGQRLVAVRAGGRVFLLAVGAQRVQDRRDGALGLGAGAIDPGAFDPGAFDPGAIDPGDINSGAPRAPEGARLHRRGPTMSKLLLGGALGLLLFGGSLAAQAPRPPAAPSLPSIAITGAPQTMSVPLQIILLLTLLTLLPAALASITPFLRILIVLHFLRQAIGTQTAPGNQTLLGLALFLTIVVMQPTADQIYREAIEPLERGEINHYEALEAAKPPLREYLLRFARENEVALFLDITGKPRPAAPADLDLTVLAPAYMLSEMKTAFQIGVVLFLPFLVIDLLAASITLSLGMIQLPPIMISTPFKLLLFVLADGWSLVVGSLVRGVA